MDSIYIFIGIFSLVFIIGLITGFFIAKNAVGEKAAKQNLLITVPSMIIGLVISVPFLLFKNGLQIFGFLSIIFSIFALIFLAFHHFKNRNFTGTHIQTFSKNQQHKILFWSGIVQLVLQTVLLVFSLWLASRRFPSISSTFYIQLGSTLTFLTMGIHFLYFGTRNNQVYENGISIMSAFIRWEKISEYEFEHIRQNTFRAKYKSDIPFIPGVISLAFSESDKQDFVQILKSKLPHLGEASVA